VVPGALFCCVSGASADGHDFAPAAVAAGAVALLVERHLPISVPQVVVASVRAAMPLVADRFFGHPSGAMAVAGVTGTNGKTTVTHLLAGALEADGRRTTLIGTLSGARTTPEAPELQATLAAARDAGSTAVAMEVSSHALVQHRVDGIEFAVGAFTNLSQDHLDYHSTMDEYFLAKARLFEDGRCHAAVIDVDSEWGLRLASMVREPVHRVSLDDAGDLRLRRADSSFTWRGQTVELAMSGRFNVANALVAATVASVLGVPDATIAAGLSSVRGVPGRFELVDAGQPFTVVVDYAHTPDGLEQVLTAARELSGPTAGACSSSSAAAVTVTAPSAH
jgi:UDP-N-acetylmuramoyl-L-alanyl-D-glutamate--2,6-diaminopimelate ligase